MEDLEKRSILKIQDWANAFYMYVLCVTSLGMAIGQW
jgi:hypothetical protein